MRSKFTFLILFSLWSSMSFAQLSLDSCQTKARENFPLIQQFDLIDASKEMTLSNAGKNYLPNLDVTMIGGVINGFPSFSAPGQEPASSSDLKAIGIVQINQLIWDGGLTKASKGIIEANAEIEKADVETALFQLEERINNLYFGILLIDEQASQLEIYKERLERNAKRVEIAIENGTAFASDRDELQVEMIKLEQKKTQLEANRSAYLTVLSSMIGEMIPEDAQLERPSYTTTLDSLENQRPELNKFEQQRALVEAQAKMNKAQIMPKIGLLGFGVLIQPGVDFGPSSLDNLLVAGLSVSWSLSPLYKNGNNKKINEITMQRIQNQEDVFRFNNDLELSQSYAEVEKYGQLIDQDKELLTLKRSIRDAYEKKQANGVATMSQLLDSINEENLAELEMIMHEIQYLMQAYTYMNKTGN